MTGTDIDILCLVEREFDKDVLHSLLKQAQASAGDFHLHSDDTLHPDNIFEHLTQHNYQLILFGDNALGMTERTKWIELIHQLTTQYPGIPLLIASMDNETSSVVDCIKAGATDYVAATNLEALANAIISAINNSPQELNSIKLDVPGLVYQLVMEPSGNLRIPFTNRFIERFTQVSPESLAQDATSIFEGIVPEDLPGLIASINESAKNMNLWQRDFRAIDPWGEVIWIRGISSPCTRPDGAIIWNGIMIDVTEEKRTLTAAQTREQAILDTVIDGIICIDEQGTIETVNKSAEKLFGYSEAEARGQNIKIFMPEPYTSEHDGYMQRYLETGEARVLGKGRQVEGRRKDGSTFPMDLAVGEMWVNGQRKFTGVVRDITSRLETETSLRENEERLRLSHDFARLVTWEWDIETDVVYWSHRFDDPDLGRHREKFVTFSQFMQTIHADDREKVKTAINTCISEGTDYEIEHRAFTRDDSRRWVLEKGNVVRDDQGRALRMIGVAQDITQQKEAEFRLRESERKLQKAQDLAQLGYWEYSYKEDSLDWSDNVYDIFGLDSAEVKPSTQAFFSGIHETDSGAVETFRDRDLLAQFPEQDIDYRMILPDRSVRWVHLESSSQFDNDGEIIGLSGTIQDITERKLAELELRQAKEEAEKARQEADIANKAKSRFLSHMSHELRTPMNAILGFTQLLELEPDLSESQVEAIAEIHHASDHLLDLINDVLDLSRIESGKVVLSVQPVPVESTISESIRMIQSLADQKGIVIENLSKDHPEHYMYVDVTRIKEVLLNLLTNAIKYNRTGGRVKIHTQLQPGKKIRLLVEDTGQGIAVEQQHNLFKSFNRLGAEYTDIEGTGIGLVISKRLIEMMGGQVGFTSKKGEGSCFWLDIPMTHRPGTRGIASVSTDRSGRKQSQLQVLYVEDNSTNLRLVQEIMSRRPFVSLTSTQDAVTTLAILKKTVPDLILLDINLPDMSGLDLLDQIRKIDSLKETPIAALSSVDLPEATEASIRRKFDEYMTKPINVRRLLHLVDEISDNKLNPNIGLSGL